MNQAFGQWSITCVNCEKHFVQPVSAETVQKIDFVQEVWSDLIKRVGYFVYKDCVGSQWFGQGVK